MDRLFASRHANSIAALDEVKMARQFRGQGLQLSATQLRGWRSLHQVAGSEADLERRHTAAPRGVGFADTKTIVAVAI